MQSNFQRSHLKSAHLQWCYWISILQISKKVANLKYICLLNRYSSSFRNLAMVLFNYHLILNRILLQLDILGIATLFYLTYLKSEKPLFFLDLVKQLLSNTPTA